ncbi:type IV toxin-antitoxin system AbiEi family antitoxin domain-containing protein [Rhodococcoides yunnanense]|uniref:type IV toxin-antitoxin system AbiEi family antitoxin domain-containing protein n=1 Tax=Rhodococcoides yunnanense TaxID=278209 RepID=UPI000933903F|nr:type IV toxin-antitoxin system AbiEi family antitoxin [Rhodococcus yunnanensis]
MSTTRPSTVELRRLAASQDGYFTVEQAESLGFDHPSIQASIVAGDWTKVERNLCRLAEWPHSDLEQFAMWCAWFGGDAVISHQSAAELHGFGHLHPQFVHVSAYTNMRLADTRLAVHRLQLTPHDFESTGTFRITTPVRTVLDLAAGGISQITLDEVVGDAVAIGRVDPGVLYAEASSGTERVTERVELALSACT